MIIPFDPATRAGRKKSDFPPKAANDSAGSVDDIRCSFPKLPQVSLQPMIPDFGVCLCETED